MKSNKLCTTSFTVLLASITTSLFFSASCHAEGLSAEDHAYYICSGCHGPDNTRVEFMSPNIIGQKKDYLLNQLKKFQNGQRRHPNMSSGVLANLSQDELEQLASYYANARQK